jgi:hypothetical protein
MTPSPRQGPGFFRRAGPRSRVRVAGRWLVVAGVECEVAQGLARALVQAARRRTSQMVAAMSRIDSASSQPPSIHWKGQNRPAGW